MDHIIWFINLCDLKDDPIFRWRRRWRWISKCWKGRLRVRLASDSGKGNRHYSEYSILHSISVLGIMVWDWEFAHEKTVCSSLIESLRGQTPDERYKMTGYTNNSQCVKATGHFESQCCYHNSLYDVFNAAVSCCDENIGPQPKGTCGTHDSSDLWKRK